jgi:hypothetical protein
VLGSNWDMSGSPSCDAAAAGCTGRHEFYSYSYSYRILLMQAVGLPRTAVVGDKDPTAVVQQTGICSLQLP